MRLIVNTTGDGQELDVRVERPDATVADLARAIEQHVRGSAGPDQPIGMVIGGLWTPGDLAIAESGLHEGVTVEVETLAPPSGLRPAPPVAGHRVEVCVIAGALAGRRIPLIEGTHVIGRDAHVDVHLPDATVSRQHGRLDVAADGTVVLTNLSTSTGTYIECVEVIEPTVLQPDSIITMGAIELRVGPPLLGDRPLGLDRFRDLTAAATLNINRPPRVADPSTLSTIDAPEAPKDPNKPPFNLSAILAPIGMAAVLFAVTQQLYVVALAAVSPLMVIGNWWESRHRSKRALRRSTREYHEQLDHFADELERARADATAATRAALPDLAEVVRRAVLPSVRLWERRPDHDDFLRLSAGNADVAFAAPVMCQQRPMPSEVASRVAEHGTLTRVPVAIDLGQGGVVGIAGDAARAAAIARALVAQAAVHHGPADLRIAMLCASTNAGDWDWTKWLPHTRDQRATIGERRLLATGPRAVDELLGALIAEEHAIITETTSRHGPNGPTTLFVVAGEDLLAGRASLTRQVLRGSAGPSAGIVVAPTIDRLPAVCTTIIDVDELGDAALIEPRVGHHRQSVLAAGLELANAQSVALALARFDDPEVFVPGAALPELVHLLPLLEFDALTDTAIARRWDDASGRHDLRAPIGLAESGPFVLDLDRHGPHGLIGGTTGSGKSELLKTIVAALAATYPPTELTFGLFDFKGGATFNEVAHLPHTVGTASDLDVHEAKRALRCLRAELLHREHLFDRARVKDLAELAERQGRGDADALAVGKVPRLVVIIDEFAAMAKELAGEIGSLADLTARGRSLGVHLLLATQKPSGAVNPEIRTNTKLRISLQVEDRQDSVDVIGIPDAADVGLKGRAHCRVGQGEVVPVQTALSTAASDTDGEPAVEIAPFDFSMHPASSRPRPTSASTSDLIRLVDSTCRVFAASSAPPPRRPWPQPLPSDLALDQLLDAGDAPPDPTAVLFALADDPEGQARYPVGWSPDHGNLLLYGIVGSGTTTTLTAVALAALDARTHLYAIDFGAGELAPLAALPHVGAVIGASDRERQVRLVRWLRADVERRQAMHPDDRRHEPRVVVLVDNFEGLRASLDDTTGAAIYDMLVRVAGDGPEVGIHLAMTATRVGAIPPALASATRARIGFRLGDVADYGALGLRRDQVPTTFVPGRAVLAGCGQEIQVARPLPTLGAAIDELVRSGARPTRPPAPIDALPAEVALDRVVVTSRLESDRWMLGIGVGDDAHEPVALTLYEHEHATIAGPARSGRSTTLLALGASLRAAQPDAVLIGIARRRSPLRGHPMLDLVATDDDQLSRAVDTALLATKPTFVLIDDADALDDPTGRVSQLLLAGLAHVRVACAGRADVLRSLYGHWTQPIRRSKAGVLLQPNLDLDGELLGATLPRRLHVTMQPGRGFVLADGHAHLVHVAH